VGRGRPHSGYERSASASLAVARIRFIIALRNRLGNIREWDHDPATVAVLEQSKIHEPQHRSTSIHLFHPTGRSKNSVFSRARDAFAPSLDRSLGRELSLPRRRLEPTHGFPSLCALNLEGRPLARALPEVWPKAVPLAHAAP
jgi:hypothetical protein